MPLSKKIAVTAGTLMLMGSFSASALETIFMQDFEAGLSPANEFIAIDPGEGAAGIDTRYVSCGGSCPFSVNNNGTQTRNFNVHDRSTNPYAGGDGHSGLPKPGGGNWETLNLKKYSPGMSGQVLGHIFNEYDGSEDNYYQIDNISLDGDLTDINLMFDFDSWIESDSPDGFAVAISNDAGTSWDLLTPNGSSEMQYRTIGTVGDNSLNVLTGQSGASNAAIVGFDGHDATMNMAGVAMFDISNSFAGDTVSLRFAFASDGDSYQAEGINIDNIKLTGVCTTGEGPNCDPPSGGGSNSVPAPATLALAAFGVMAIRRRRT